MTITIDNALAVFERHWGFTKFRKYQEAVIEPALAGEDVIAVLPTGAGKSACFQVPALCVEGGAIVVSPLIALMKDQVDGCARRGIPAGCVHSHMDDEDKIEAIEDFKAGALKLLYVSPERLNNRTFIETMQRIDVSYIVIDEAHCCSEWGHQFRPDYMRIHRLVRALTGKDGARPPILALTATATSLVINDIKKAIGMHEDACIVVADPVRTNLNYITEPEGNPWRQVREWISSLDVTRRAQGAPSHHIVYTVTKRTAEQIAEIAEQEFWPGVAAAYHAGMSGDRRTEVQDAFVSGETPIICATTAFGMGIDVPTIRTVVNFGVPGSIEAFVQQSGRAGRDGLASSVVLIYDEWSIGFQQQLVSNANPPIPLYNMVWDWLHDALGDPSGSIRTTHREAAQSITALRRGQIHPEQFGVILNVLHSRGLVERRVIDGGLPLMVSPEKYAKLLNDLDTDKAKDVIKHVWRVLWQFAIEKEVRDARQSPVSVIVNKEAVRHEAGVTAYMVGKAIEALNKRGVVPVIEDSFRGTEVRVLPDKWRVDLHEHLPVQAIEEKRQSDFRRLSAMLDYARLRTEPERKAAIRAYFLTPEDAV